MITVSPASLADLAEMQQYYPKRTYQALVYQITRSPSLTLRDGAGGRIVAICGLYPDHGEGDAFLHVARDIAGTPVARAVVRALIRIVRDLPRSVQIVAHVRRGHEPGERLARLVGMENAGEAYGGIVTRYVRARHP